MLWGFKIIAACRWMYSRMRSVWVFLLLQHSWPSLRHNFLISRDLPTVTMNLLSTTTTTVRCDVLQFLESPSGRNHRRNRRPLARANMHWGKHRLRHCEEWLAKTGLWCISGGIDHCYDWGVQTQWTVRGRVTPELFELSGLCFTQVWGMRGRG